MNTQTEKVIFGCLLHDVGKIAYRSLNETAGTHSEQGYEFLKKVKVFENETDILNCARYHHKAVLSNVSSLSEDAPCYIAYVADNISSGVDRRSAAEEGTFDRYVPMSSVFSRLNGSRPDYVIPFSKMDGQLRIPSTDRHKISPGNYTEVINGIKTGLDSIQIGDSWVDSLLSVLESWTTSLPSSTYTGESVDISLFDHLKITAAVGSCISEYMISLGKTNYKRDLFDNEKSFYDEKSFLLYSADFSGIQKFIYMIPSGNALKNLRSRSFFLEMSMEHYIDELLEYCGLSRVNLIYSGGGHCYFLLPNTADVINKVDDWNRKFNSWLLDKFGTGLYLAHGYTECSANELMNKPENVHPYKDIFRRVSREIAKRKNSRYTSEQIKNLNTKHFDDTRECGICGKSDNLSPDRNGILVCSTCLTFEKISSKIQQNDVYTVTVTDDNGFDFVLPSLNGDLYFSFSSENAVRELLKSSGGIKRVYSKNRFYTGMRYSTKIYVGDYNKDNELQKLSEASEGINRLGVLRMDIDNLGQAFVSGFENHNASSDEERYKYVTLSRIAAFSRQMSAFFKFYINGILSGPPALEVSIVYSGGDDVFIVGAWNDTIEAALRIRDAFEKYSCGSLTISGGIAVLDSHYPIRLAAQRAGELEDEAKSNAGKNSISIFEPNGKHCYTWNEYISEVLEKKNLLDDFFNGPENDKGMTFLYNIKELLEKSRDSGSGKIYLARFAYILARLEPKEDPKKHQYNEFAKNVYKWALDPKDRRQLISAIYIFVYENRKRKNLEA